MLPDIVMSKDGRNFTAGQVGYTEIVSASPAGDTVEWRLRISNNGQATAKNVELTDTLPANMTFVSISPVPTSGSYPTWKIIDIPVGTTATYLITATVGGTCQTDTQNTASVKWGCTASPAIITPSKPSDTATLRTKPSFTSGGVSITHPSPWTTCGGPVRITLTNTGDTATFSEVFANLRTGYVYDASQSPSCTINSNLSPHPGNPLVCNPDYTTDPKKPRWTSTSIDKINRGETITIDFWAKMDGTYCDTEPIINNSSHPDVDVPSVNNEATYTFKDSCNTSYLETAIDPIDPVEPDLDISISPDKQIVAEGSQAAWTVTVTNNGSTQADNNTLIFTLGNGYSNTEYSLNGVGGPWISYASSIALPSITPGAANSRNINVRADVGSGSLSFKAHIEGECHDQSGGAICKHSYDDFTAYVAGYAMTKTVDKATANVGELITYTVRADFTNTDTFLNINVVDTLPPYVEYILATATANNERDFWRSDSFCLCG